MVNQFAISGTVKSVQVKKNKKGKPYLVATVESEEATIPVYLFDQDIHLEEGWPVFVQGKLFSGRNDSIFFRGTEVYISPSLAGGQTESTNEEDDDISFFP
jgi:DNA polymerase III alpha subunit